MSRTLPVTMCDIDSDFDFSQVVVRDKKWRCHATIIKLLIAFLLVLTIAVQQYKSFWTDSSLQLISALEEKFESQMKKQRDMIFAMEETAGKIAVLSTKLDNFLDREMNRDIGLEDYAQGGEVVPADGAEGLKGSYLSQTMKDTILMPSFFPGDCWSIQSDHASFFIRLSSDIYVENVTVEHLHASRSPTGETSSSPKEFSLWGTESTRSESGNGHLFGYFTYDNGGPAVQTFPIQSPSRTPYGIVRLQIISNHGNPKFTCIYRVRIHGREPSSKNLYFIL